MAVKEIVQSLTIDFSGSNTTSNQGVLKLEIDGRPDGLNKGKTSGFLPGESVGILAYRGSGVTIKNIKSSVGSVVNVGSGTKTISTDLVFADTNQASLAYPSSGGFDGVWLGRSLGSLVVLQDTNVLADNSGVAIFNAEYTAAFDTYRLQSIPAIVGGKNSYKVIVVFYAEQVL